MTGTAETAAYRLLSFNWAVLGAIALTLAICLPLTGFSIAPASLGKPLALAAAYVGLAYFNLCCRRKPDATMIFILGSTGQLLLIPILLTPLTYIAASAGLPFQDSALMAIDRALGLDWMGYFNFVYRDHTLMTAAVLGYSMIAWPLLGVPVVLCAMRRYRRAQEFTLAFAVALIVTTVVSIFVPAMGTYDLLNFRPDPAIYTPGSYLAQLRDLPMVRDGSLRHLEVTRLAGLVSFPSFHAASAALYLWALWPARWFRPIALAANLAMLASTPICGGHYFIDVIAGIAVAAGAVVAALRIARRLAAVPEDEALRMQGAALAG